MKIEWNKVTWYSKMIALVLFIALPFIGFYLGVWYESATNPSTTTVLEKTVTSSAKPY